MSEGMPTPIAVRAEAPLTRAEVVERLRQVKLSPEELDAYVETREASVHTEKDNLKLSIDLAEIFAEAGNKEGARDLFEIAVLEAEQQEAYELRSYCVNRLDQIEKGAFWRM